MPQKQPSLQTAPYQQYLDTFFSSVQTSSEGTLGEVILQLCWGHDAFICNAAFGFSREETALFLQAGKIQLEPWYAAEPYLNEGMIHASSTAATCGVAASLAMARP